MRRLRQPGEADRSIMGSDRRPSGLTAAVWRSHWARRRFCVAPARRLPRGPNRLRPAQNRRKASTLPHKRPHEHAHRSDLRYRHTPRRDSIDRRDCRGRTRPLRLPRLRRAPNRRAGTKAGAPHRAPFRPTRSITPAARHAYAPSAMPRRPLQPRDGRS